MTPKEKAIELVDKMHSISGQVRFSKGYALIAVDEEIKTIEKLWSKYSCDCLSFELTYLEQVKSEIEKL